MRWAAVLSALILLGCSCDGGAHAPDAGRPPPSPPAPRSAREETARDWLRAQAISDTHFGAAVLYTWLLPDDVASLRAGGSVTATTAPPRSHTLDEHLAGDPSPVARALLDAARAGRQPAWPSAWAARLGWAYTDRTGDQLARVELRPESLIVVYDLRTLPPTIHFSTERGVAAPFAEASQVPQFWAAVLLIDWDRHDDGGRSVWRHYVLVNPSMIGRVSMGSPEIASELRVERERLTQLAHDLGADREPPTDQDLDHAWAALPDRDAPTERLFAAAIPSDRYALARPSLVDLVTRLVDTSEPFEWRTSVPSEPRPQFFE